MSTSTVVACGDTDLGVSSSDEGMGLMDVFHRRRSRDDLIGKVTRIWCGYPRSCRLVSSRAKNFVSFPKCPVRL